MTRSNRLDAMVRKGLAAQASWYESPLVITGVGIVVSVVLALVVDAFGGSGLAGVAFGIAATLLTLQIDALAQIARRHRGDDEDSQLLAELDRTPWIRGEFRRIASAAASHDFASTPILATIAHSHLMRAAESFERISPGGYRGQPDNQDLITLMEAAQTSVQATSIIRGELGYWSSDDGREYWEANVRALGRNVKITRIFIIIGPDADVAGLLEEQQQAGVDVHTVAEDALPADLLDYVLIFDDQWGQRIHVTVGGSPTEYRVMVDGEQIRRARRQFEAVLNRATSYIALQRAGSDPGDGGTSDMPE